MKYAPNDWVNSCFSSTGSGGLVKAARKRRPIKAATENSFLETGSAMTNIIDLARWNCTLQTPLLAKGPVRVCFFEMLAGLTCPDGTPKAAMGARRYPCVRGCTPASEFSPAGALSFGAVLVF